MVLMAVINSELSDTQDDNEIQKRLTLWIVSQFPEQEAKHVLSRLKAFTNTPEESVQIFKAYLLVVEDVNEKDRKELTAIRGQVTKEYPYFFQKLVWPLLLKQL